MHIAHNILLVWGVGGMGGGGNNPLQKKPQINLTAFPKNKT